MVRGWRVTNWGKAHPLAVDAAITVGIAAVSLIAHFFQSAVDDRIFRQPNVLTVTLVLAACLPLVWRRSHPIAVVLVVAVVQSVCESIDINGPNWAPFVIAVYGLGAYASGRRRIVAGTVTALIVGILVLNGLLADVISLPEAIGAATSMSVPVVIGDNVRRRRNELIELGERAERLEREREMLAGQRVAEERTRIARELHDVVAHSVSAIVIQAAAARRNLERSPADAADLLGNIEQTGRNTMNELRQILGVLRDASTDDQVEARPTAPAPVPSIADLEQLVDSAADLDVTLSTSGRLDSVPSGVAASAFRVVQEALTNVRRHAGPNVTIDVRIERCPDRLDVSVEDNGRGASVGGDPGYGLVGMRERVAAFGGTLRAGPRRNGGWHVRASFPIAEAHGAPAIAGAPS